MRELQNTQERARDKRPRREGGGKAPLRKLALMIARHLAGVTRLALRRGMARSAIAAALQLHPQTLESHLDRRIRRKRSSQARGRPPRVAPQEIRHEILLQLATTGGGQGVRQLRVMFPGVAYREFAYLKNYLLTLARWRGRALTFGLTWTQPGRVWATDLTQAPVEVEGGEKFLLMVRDLASGKHLTAEAVAETTAAGVRDAMHKLFLRQDPPLALKSDNGGQFVGEVMTELLREFGVVPLLSPPATPRYNGSVEAGIGSIKHRADLSAVREGHPEHWTYDDIEWARLDANARGRPRALEGPSPDEAWNQRTPITAAERQRFQSRHQVNRAQAYASAGSCRGVELDAPRRAAIERQAVEQTLKDLDLFRSRRRWVSPSVPTSGTRKISR